MGVEDLRVYHRGVRHYRHPHYGDDYPSVTSILNAWPDLDDRLAKWQAKIVAGNLIDAHQDGSLERRLVAQDRADVDRWAKTAADRERDFAADRGSLVHDALETWARSGETIHRWDPALEANAARIDRAGAVHRRTDPDPIRAAALAAAAWPVWEHLVRAIVELGVRPYVYSDPMGGEWICAEPVFFNPHERYAGTGDLYADTHLGFYLLDLKTSNTVHHDYALQLAGYHRAPQILFEQPGRGWLMRVPPLPERAGILHVTEHGWALHEVVDIERAWWRFQQCARMWRAANDYEWPFRKAAFWDAARAAAVPADPFEGLSA